MAEGNEKPRILVVRPGQNPVEAEKMAQAEQQVAAQRAALEQMDQQIKMSMSQVVRALFMSFSRTREMAIEVCLEHIAQLAIQGGIEKKQIVAWLFERCSIEEESHRKAKEAACKGLTSALQAMRAQGLKVPPNIVGQVNLLQLEMEPELKEWFENNQAPTNQLATPENMMGAPPGAVQ